MTFDLKTTMSGMWHTDSTSKLECHNAPPPVRIASLAFTSVTKRVDEKIGQALNVAFTLEPNTTSTTQRLM